MQILDTGDAGDARQRRKKTGLTASVILLMRSRMLEALDDRFVKAFGDACSNILYWSILVDGPSRLFAIAAGIMVAANPIVPSGKKWRAGCRHLSWP